MFKGFGPASVYDVIILGGIGVGAYFIFFTDYGKQLLAQLTGGGFATYDPKKTDLFPYAGLLENTRKEAQDWIGDIMDPKNEASIKGLASFDKSKIPIPKSLTGYKLGRDSSF